MQTLEGLEYTPFIPKALLSIAQEIDKANGASYLVGGWVRDALLAEECRDFDVEVYGLDQDVLLKILSQYGRPNLVGRAFGVIHLAHKGFSLDFSFPRTESKVGEGHRGFLVQTHTHLSFQEAAYRRDFTINAMGMKLPDLVLEDPYGGRDDLEKRILRHVSPAFAEDSLRVLRGVQFASRFHLTLAPETTSLCRTLSIEDLSYERIFEEFKKWLLKPGKPSLGLQAFLDMDLNRFFPEIQPLNGSWELLGSFLDAIHESSVSFSATNQLILAFTALLSENKEEQAINHFLERITNEIKILRGVPLLWREVSLWKPERENLAESSIRRLSLRLGGLELLECYSLAAPYNTKEEKELIVIPLMEKAKEIGVYINPPEPILTGKMLMDLGFKPGKFFGELIQESFELQLDGILKTEADVLTWVQEKKATSI